MFFTTKANVAWDWLDTEDHTDIAVTPSSRIDVGMLGRLCRISTLEKDWLDRLEQFTGLQDSQGRDIYEGDIVEYINNGWTTGKRYVITARPGYFWLQLTPDPLDAPNHGAAVLGFYHHEYRILGNIHENPELLT